MSLVSTLLVIQDPLAPSLLLRSPQSSSSCVSRLRSKLYDPPQILILGHHPWAQPHHSGLQKVVRSFQRSEKAQPAIVLENRACHRETQLSRKPAMIQKLRSSRSSRTKAFSFGSQCSRDIVRVRPRCDRKETGARASWNRSSQLGMQGTHQ